MLTAPGSEPKVRATVAENTIGKCDQDKVHIEIYPRFETAKMKVVPEIAHGDWQHLITFLTLDYL